MSHIAAILRNQHNAAFRRKLEAQVTAPLTLLSEIYFPASSTALPTYDTGYNNRPLRHSRIEGSDANTPVLSAVFCASVQMGIKAYGPDGDAAHHEFMLRNRAASDLCFQIVADLKQQDVRAWLIKAKKLRRGVSGSLVYRCRSPDRFGTAKGIYDQSRIVETLLFLTVIY